MFNLYNPENENSDDTWEINDHWIELMELKEYWKSTQRVLKQSFTNVMDVSHEEQSPKKIFV